MKFLTCILVAASLSTFAAPSKPIAKKDGGRKRIFVSQYENVLGTSMELKVSAETKVEAAKAERTALMEIGRLSKILSGYDPDSEFNHWLKTKNQPVRVSEDLFEVLRLFDIWRLRSGGALDASAEIITRLWKQAAAAHAIPSRDELDRAVEEVKEPHWTLDEKTRTAIHLGDAPLMLNSFVKSYIIQSAAQAVLRNVHIGSVVVNIGGDLVIRGDRAENVVVRDPKADAENDPPIADLELKDRAVATSGSYRRGELINGSWYSHIVDPRTGIPAGEVISATVVAPSATDAGALATAFNVLDPSESEKLAAEMPSVEYLIITREGRHIESRGWPGRSENKPGAQPVIPVGKGNETWPDDFELMVNLEINLQKQGNVKRPYVAIWVEDENHAPVRTITVWHGSDRYMPELKSWYLKYRDRYHSDSHFNSSVTSATRSAGKYTVKWDGKDDEGNLVKPGKYIIKIEASREHGTYQLMRQEIMCDEIPKTFNLDGNVEIASASIDYRKKTSN